MRRYTKTMVYDKLHRGSVLTLMGLTLFGCSLLGVRIYRYFTVVRPIQKEHKQMIAEESMAQHQIEAELRRKQEELETLKG